MKKSLVITLALVFVLGLAGTAFAANPFSDVPAKSWAYDAVAKLQKAGIIDGYNDGSFKGDKTITRYEMAIIVAKAMAKEDKANAEDKAIIDKLAAEFKSELDNLGVRVAALEAKSDNVKWSGFFRARTGSDTVNGAEFHNSATKYYLLTVNADAKVNDTTNAHFVSETRYGYTVNGQNWAGVGGTHNDDAQQDGAANFFRAWVDTKLGDTTLTTGRRWAGYADNTFVGTEQDGVWVDLPAGDITASLFYTKNTDEGDGYLNNNNNLYGINLNVPLSKTTSLSLLYGGNKDKDATDSENGVMDSWGEITLNAKLTQDFNLAADFGKTNANVDNKHTNIQLTYKAADVNNPQTWDVFVRYFNSGAYGAPIGDTEWNAYLPGTKAWTVGFDYAVAKNVMWETLYSHQDGTDLGAFNGQTRKLVRTQFDFNF